MLLEPPSLGSRSTNNKLEGRRRRKVGTLGIGGGRVWFQCRCQTAALYTLWWAEKECVHSAALRSCGSDCLVSHLSLSRHSLNLPNESSVGSKQRREWLCIYQGARE